VSVGESHTTTTTMTESLIHEADVTRWLLGEEITAVDVIPSRRSSRALPHLRDPLFACFTTASGVLSTAEFFANCQYGYDVRCELVGSHGTASLLNPVVAGRVVAGQASEAVPTDWRVRWAVAYEAELRAWIEGIDRGECAGPSAWDGYAATRVTELGVEAVRSGRRVEIDYVERPALYG
jgi:myo-inositol 2-dehydrogenase/D-chiro-inositol 1-dehydrogenase